MPAVRVTHDAAGEITQQCADPFPFTGFREQVKDVLASGDRPQATVFAAAQLCVEQTVDGIVNANDVSCDDFLKNSTGNAFKHVRQRHNFAR